MLSGLILADSVGHLSPALGLTGAAGCLSRLPSVVSTPTLAFPLGRRGRCSFFPGIFLRGWKKNVSVPATVAEPAPCPRSPFSFLRCHEARLTPGLSRGSCSHEAGSSSQNGRGGLCHVFSGLEQPSKCDSHPLFPFQLAGREMTLMALEGPC